MRDIAVHSSYIGLRVIRSLHGLSPSSRRRDRRPPEHFSPMRGVCPPEHFSRMRGASLGFTLIEAVVAMAILMVIVAATFSTVSFVYSTGAATEGLNTAKNITNYVVEALRGRTQTSQNVLVDQRDFSSGLHDLCGDALVINTNAVAPDEDDALLLGGATYTCLQGVVSLRASPPDDTVACEDPNLKIHDFNGTLKYADYTESDTDTGLWQPAVVQLPVVLGSALYA